MKFVVWRIFSYTDVTKHEERFCSIAADEPFRSRPVVYAAVAVSVQAYLLSAAGIADEYGGIGFCYADIGAQRAYGRLGYRLRAIAKDVTIRINLTAAVGICDRVGSLFRCAYEIQLCAVIV